MHSEGPIDELDLLRRVRNGDADALRELMVHYDRLVRYAVFRLCRTECRRDGQFLDARASEAWTGFVDSIRRRDSALPRNLKTYLIQIVRNKCTDALRRSGGPDAGPQALGSLEAPSEPAVETLIRAEQVLALRSCLSLLSEDDKRIYGQIELILDGRWRQAGEALAMPESTLRTRWPGILSRLKRCVEGKTQESFAPPAGGTDS